MLGIKESILCGKSIRSFFLSASPIRNQRGRWKRTAELTSGNEKFFSVKPQERAIIENIVHFERSSRHHQFEWRIKIGDRGSFFFIFRLLIPIFIHDFKIFINVSEVKFYVIFLHNLSLSARIL